VLREHGCVVVEDALSAREVDALSTAISALEAGHPRGRNVFEGEQSHRLYSLVTQGRPFEEIAQHPVALEILDALLLPNWLLSNCQSIRLYPGETRQPWHSDDSFYFVPRPHAPLGVSSIWALEPFTAVNGATELVVGSHRWGAEHPDDREGLDVVAAEMAPGSVLWFDAALWHRGGANDSDGTRLCMTLQYCQPWLRPQESQLLIAPPDVARRLPARVRTMLGYSIHPPFIGQVEGKHPLRLVDEDAYRARRGDDAEIADRVLTDPKSAERALRGIGTGELRPDL
jgi:ectoine hydroxylase-related dioxygenase (phytanoyl-CoA dioxygenase family)